MVQTPIKPVTLEAFLALPETKPASEYFDGKITQKPMPQGEHSRIQLKLAAAIEAALSAEKVASAFTELRCTFDGSPILRFLSGAEFRARITVALRMLLPLRRTGLLKFYRLGKVIQKSPKIFCAA